MAAAPVNRAWFVQITPNWTVKTSEAQYQEAIDYWKEKVVTVEIAKRTDRTLRLCDISPETLTKAGFSKKEGRVWGKVSEQDYDFSA